MRYAQLLFFLLLSQIILAQSNLESNLNGIYRYPIDSSGNHVSLILGSDQGFELIFDNIYDCTPSYVVYGKGRFVIFQGQYLDLLLDSILHAPSIVEIDSTDNPNGYGTLLIRVNDTQNFPLNGLTLGWSAPRIQFGKNRIAFFERKFDRETLFTLPSKKRPVAMWVEKANHRRATIDLEQLSNKDYQVLITLNSRPAIESVNYLSPGLIRFSIISDCQLAFDDVILTKQDCK